MPDDMASLVARVNPEMRPQVAELAKNVIFMRERLAVARDELAGEPLVVEYDNGGGQTGTRKNPAYDAYEALLRSYQSALGCLRDILGANASGGSETKSDLSKLRDKFRVVPGA